MSLFVSRTVLEIGIYSAFTNYNVIGLNKVKGAREKQEMLFFEDFST